MSILYFLVVFFFDSVHYCEITKQKTSLPLLSCGQKNCVGLPWRLSGKEAACQCRRQWSDPTCLRATKPTHHNY